MLNRKVRPIKQNPSGGLPSAGGTRLAAAEVKRRSHSAPKEYGCQSSRAAARGPGLPDALLCFAMADPLIVGGLFVKINFMKKNS